MKIFVEMPVGPETDSFMTKENIEALESLGEVTWNKLDRHLTPEELRDALVDVDVLVCGWRVPQLTGEVLSKANKLKLVAYTAGTVSHVATDEMYDKGIRIVGGNEGFAESVAEGAMCYMLAGQRRLKFHNKYMAANGGRQPNFENNSLLDKTVGIVGYGSISRHLLRMLKPFHVKVKLYSNHTTEEQAAQMGVQKADLKEIFSTCDIISLHCARSAANFHLITDELLGMMKDNALLVNTARGDIIDEQALIRHLQTGRIRAALDVYEVEMPPMDSPLRKMSDDVLLMPHMGGPTMDYRYYSAKLVIDDIRRFQNGEELQNEILPWRAKMMTK